MLSLCNMGQRSQWVGDSRALIIRILTLVEGYYEHLWTSRGSSIYFIQVASVGIHTQTSVCSLDQLVSTRDLSHQPKLMPWIHWPNKSHISDAIWPTWILWFIVMESKSSESLWVNCVCNACFVNQSLSFFLLQDNQKLSLRHFVGMMRYFLPSTCK